MKNFYSLTCAQQTIWNIEKFHPNISINNITGTLRFKEDFEFLLLEEAVNALIKNNEAIRMRILIQNGEPNQYIAGYKFYPLNFFDLSQENDNQKFYKLEEHLTATPFHVIDSDLFYIAYFKLSGETAIFFKFHHLIADAWSLTLVADQVLDYYLRLKNKEVISDEISPSYVDYISTEKKYLESEQFSRNKAFWQTKVSAIPEFIYLKTRPAQYSTKANRQSFLIPEELSAKINQYCKDKNVSIFVLFVAIFSIYINRTASKNDIILGTTVLNRINHKEKNTVGMFINTIPFRLNIVKPVEFNSFIGYIYAEWRNILRNERYPYDLIIKDYRKKNQTTGDIFDVAITYQNAVLNFIKNFEKVKGRWHPYGHQTNSLNIHINNREKSNTYVVNMDYLTELYTADEIRRLYHHLMNLLSDALDNPAKSVTEFELISEDEKYKLLHEFNNSQSLSGNNAYTHGSGNLYRLFEEQVAQHPENTALIFENTKLTYRELNEKVNQLAWVLKDKGVQSNTIVGLLIKRSLEMFIGVLGILKAGGAYLPIDFNNPDERIKFVLEDSNCKILLTNDFLVRNFTWDGEVINLKEIPEHQGGNNLQNEVHPDDLAYIIYTSGSTGKPKGVMIEHHSITNTVQWRIGHYNFSDQEVLLQIPPYNFDSSVEDIFSFLSVGATLIIIDQDKRLDLMYLKQLIIKFKVTHFLVTPLLYKIMLDEIADVLSHMTSITVAGEDFQIGLVKKHFEKLPYVKLFNEYGPTENSVCSTVYQFSCDDEEVLIGKPIDHCLCYVLNQDLDLQPIGFPGELYLGGPGLARGYTNPELTNERFIFAPNFNGRLYKTGDLVKWTPEGNLKFIERIDNQIKIRGFRVELDEIKNTIQSFNAIKDAVVIAKEGHNSNTLICAYLVAEDWCDISQLKEFLNLHLPNYMIPSHFIFIDHIPLTLNGKIDKTQLPELIEKEKLIIMPENEIEKRLVKVWKDIFKVDIGTTDDIFECGADSIGFIQVLTMVYKDNWNLSVQDFYKYRTIKELADYISRSSKPLPEPVHKRQSSAERFVEGYFDKNNLKLTEKNSIHNVLLTGATGFLGSHILYELLKTTEAKIFCLVRGRDEVEAINKLHHITRFYFPNIDENLLKERVVVIKGDLTRKQMGLPELEYSELTQTIDTVIHAAALVKHYGDYSVFEKINVYGVEEIAAFSLNKNLFYLSTTSVSGNYGVSSLKNIHFTEDNFDIGQSFYDNSYVRSKFEGEKIIRAKMQNGHNASIIRIGNLTGRYTDGYFQINISENKFYNILKSIVELKSIPKSLLYQKLEFTPVDKCSEAIVKLMKVNDSKGKTFHLMNDNYVSLKTLVGIFEKCGYRIRFLRDNIFYQNLKIISEDLTKRHMLFGLVTNLQNGRLNYHSSIVVDSNFSKQFLRLLEFEWPEIDEGYFDKIMKYIEQVNFFESELV